MKITSALLITACLTALLTGCVSQSEDKVLTRLVFDRGHGSMWGNQFYIELCEEEIICIRYIPEGSAELVTQTEIPLTDQMWEQIVSAVGELELKPEKAGKKQVLDGTEYRRLTLTWEIGGKEKTVNYSFSPAAQKLEALLESLIPKKIPEDTACIDGGVRHYQNTDAPKTITSTEMVSFDLTFSAKTRLRQDTCLAGHDYRLKAGLTEDGVWGTYQKDKGEEETFHTDVSFMKGLLEVVNQYDFAQYNGNSYSVSGLPDFFGARLEITYASGEQIYASNNQSCFIPIEALEELVQQFQSLI